eukprot:scaffold438484_cov41-Prasinocladus_malaysianus.AAC.1
MYTIQDNVSGTEWVVDGEQKPGGDVQTVWREKRVKDASTGKIISLAELEQILVDRVVAQVGDGRPIYGQLTRHSVLPQR